MTASKTMNEQIAAHFRRGVAPSTVPTGIRQRAGNKLYWLLFALVLAGRAGADDTELFISTEDQDLRCEAPNVVFLIDTSGSMSDEVITQSPYEAGTVYPGCFASDSYYYGTTGTPPDCESNPKFDRSANQCAAADGTEYTGSFLAWNDELAKWVTLTEADEDWIVECADDEGLHGNGTGDGTYAIDGEEGPWSDSPANAVAWGSNASSVTIYDGNYQNWLAAPPTETTTRMAVVKSVTKTAADNMANVNIALMTFNRLEGGSVIYASEPLQTALEPFKRAVDELTPGGRTPLSESLYEAGQYLAGRDVRFGKPFYGGESVPEAYTGGTTDSPTYLSPLTSGGQNNYIVLLTDGGPSDDLSAASLIQDLPGYADIVGEPCSLIIDGDCLDNMAEYLFKADLRPDVEGQQNVITHTIGFNIASDPLAEPLLAATAERGGGKFFIADDTTALTRALSDLSQDFARSASILAPPAIPINSFNRSERQDSVFLSVFEPAATQHWPGNLKKYRVARTEDGTQLLDSLDNPALNPATGLFNRNAVSFWSSPTVDGDNVQSGGASSQLPAPAERILYSNDAAAEPQLIPFTSDNAEITAALVGAPEAERTATIEWARGRDVRDKDGDGDVDEPRFEMGDPLHVQALTVAYGDSEEADNPVVFISTNDGYLHAFDADSGVEIWSFIPRRLLSRLYELSLGEAAANKQYGLDGELRLVETDNRKLLVFGMRRGGEALFAIDISTRTLPRLAWIIDSSQPDFLDLGQTWSPVQSAKVSINNNPIDVLIFGGGYDPGQDNNVFRSDTKGNAVYIVNAATGALEWSAGSMMARSRHDLELGRMQFSIPAGLRVIDINRDGLDDRIYFGDMGGQVWRIDLINGRTRNSLAEGGVLASLGVEGDSDITTATDLRRFYNSPDVVELISNDKLFIAINIGSGYRAHPLSTATFDEFYSIRDYHAAQTIPTNAYGTEPHPVLTRNDLLDITDIPQPELEPNGPGWRLGMAQSPGEKILSSSLTIKNTLFFNSFAPPVAATNSCLPGGGLNRLYLVNVLTGGVLMNLDKSTDDTPPSPEDRFVVGDTNQVPLAPILGPDGICSGLDCFSGKDAYDVDNDVDSDNDPGPGGRPRRVNSTYWFPDPRP